MNKPLVLIVDDEPLIAVMVEMAFLDAGFDVRTAMDAVEAAVRIGELDTQLSALVTDVRLGAGPDGWAVAAGARRNLPRLPVVYMTGDSAADWEAFGVPDSVMVQKPFVVEQVLDAVTSLIDAKQQGRPSAG